MKLAALLTALALPILAGTAYIEVTCYTPFSVMGLESAPTPDGPWTDVTNIYYEFSTNFDVRPVVFNITNTSTNVTMYFRARQR